uniref:Baculoviral IAP repeat-containing protein 5.2-B n=1 Tax=Xenopus laevis TaxID=8355 RepID=BI52B_XENLA|nr:RecName: Full=Baculoviral IAP repeat-containing protein 5.2-B; AltName: Full=Survivin in Xenopus; Short=SIX; AltName: Full=Survivin2-B; Short=XSurvivin2B [Xenopus laevis]AAI69762.1 SIX [Xenopus laevis]AAI69764.1 SIX [Xenopus laevis]
MLSISPIVSLRRCDNEPSMPDEWRLYNLATRLRTFSNWPFTEDCACTPERMAEAGFVHCPTDNSPDVVKCFFCLKELEGWQPEDDPMDEHKKHSPSCLFIALKKKAEELTLSEFLKLDLEHMKIKMQKQMNLHIERFQAKANEVRGHLEKLDADETQ